MVTGTHGTGVTKDTPFVLGSLSKSFTALAVLQLVDQGKVLLDAPVTGYLPRFRTAEPGVVPTVRQLLEQTSGLPTKAGTVDLSATGRTLRERVARIAAVRPNAVPGTRFQYCNLNYATLGLLVETVSGESYPEYLRHHVLDPLAMTHSYTSMDDARAAGLPDGSTTWFGLTVRERPVAFPGALPDGYLISSAEDLSHYLRLQLDGGSYEGRRLLSSRLTALMHGTLTVTPPDAAAPGTDGYGMGWATGRIGDRPLIAHQGDVVGFHSDLGALPREHAGLAVLTARNSALLDNGSAYRAGLESLAGRQACRSATTSCAPTFLGSAGGYLALTRGLGTVVQGYPFDPAAGPG